jgi:hypothetical protein
MKGFAEIYSTVNCINCINYRLLGAISFRKELSSKQNLLFRQIRPTRDCHKNLRHMRSIFF